MPSPLLHKQDQQRGDEAEDGGALCQSAADQQGAVDLTGGLRLAGDGLAGLSGGDSLFYQVLVGLVNTLTTVLALAIIDKVGRKKLVYYGVSGMILSLVLIGFYFIK